MDSGIDAGDEAIGGYYNTIEGDVAPWYFEDMTGHGTSIAGIINYIAPEADLYSVKVLDGNNVTSLSKVVSGIYWCIDNDIDIINMSFGTAIKSEVLHKAVQDACDAGILMIAAAGNCAEKGVQYPAAFSEVMAVGAVDSKAEKTDQSAVGDDLEIVAPGQQIVCDGLFGTKVVMGGTSMAAPHVTGAAALILSKDKKRTAEYVRSLLGQSAKPLGERDKYGQGLLDVKYALKKYKKFSKAYDKMTESKRGSNSDNIIEINSSQVELTDVNYIEGTWADHKKLFEMATSGVTYSNLQQIKVGSIMPDQIKCIRGDVFPTLHGRNNYIANTIAVTRLAVKGEDNCRVESISSDSGEVSDAKAIISALKGLTASDWKQAGLSGKPSASNRKWYYYGVAIHIATDAVAHHSYMNIGGKWTHIVHKGYASGADDPSTVPERYTYAKHLAYRIVRAAMADHQASYTTFYPDDQNLRSQMLGVLAFKLYYLTEYAYRTNSAVLNDSSALALFNLYSYIGSSTK